MNEIIEELIAVIAKEIEAFEELLKTLREKQRAIVEGEVQKLNNSVENEVRLARETKHLEVERIEQSQRIAEKLALENITPKLSEIIENVEHSYAQRLTEQRQLLRDRVSEIQILNKKNQYLLNYSLSFIEQTMDMLFAGNESKNIYKKDGKLKKEVKQVIDRSI